MVNMTDIIDEFGLTYLRISTDISTREIDCQRELLETAYDTSICCCFSVYFHKLMYENNL